MSGQQQQSQAQQQLAGHIFGCTGDTLDECLGRKLFGLPAAEWDTVRHIRPGCPLWLYNYSTQSLLGGFEAREVPGFNQNPHALGYAPDGSGSAFPAQVQVQIKEEAGIPAAPLSELVAIVPDLFSSLDPPRLRYSVSRDSVRRLMALFRDLDARQGSLPQPAPRGLPLPKRPAEAQLPRPAKAARHSGPAAEQRSSYAPPPGSLIQPASHSRSAAQGALPLPLPMPLQRPLDFSDEFEEPEQPGRQQPPAFLPVPPMGLRPRQTSPSSYSPHVPELPPAEPHGSPGSGHYPSAFSPQPFADPGLLLPQPGPRQQHQRGQQHPHKLSQKQQVKQQRQQAKQQAKQQKQQAKAAKQQKGKAGKLPPKPAHERGQAGPRAVPKAACSILLHDVPQAMSADALVRLLDGPGGAQGQYDLLRVYPSVKGLPSQSAVVHFREPGQAAALWERLCSSTWAEMGAPQPAAEAGERPHVWVLSTDTLGSLRASTQLRKRETIEYEGPPSGYSLPSDVTCVFYMPGALPLPADPVIASGAEEGELPAARHQPVVFRASPEKDGVGVGEQQQGPSQNGNGGHASPEQAELLRQQRELEQQAAAAAAYDQELDALLSEGAAAAQPDQPEASRVVSGSSNGFTVTVRGSAAPQGTSPGPVQPPQFGDDFLAL